MELGDVRRRSYHTSDGSQGFTKDQSNVSRHWTDKSEDVWISYRARYFFDGNDCQFRSLSYEPILGHKVAHNKIIDRRIRERAKTAIAQCETKDGRAEIMDYLFTVEWGRDKNKDYFDPLGFFDLYQPIQMSVAEISQYDWFNEDLYHPYYFQFSQA